jgi:hypothetical protein
MMKARRNRKPKCKEQRKSRRMRKRKPFINREILWGGEKEEREEENEERGKRI